MKMAKAGCKAIYWGAECFNQRLLDLIKKGTKVEVMKDVLKRAYLQGIKNYLLIIYNLPTES